MNQQLALLIMTSVLSLALAKLVKNLFTGYVSSRSDGSVDLVICCERRW